MINLDPYITRAQIGFAMMAIAFVFVWRFFVKYEVPIKFSQER